jgi:predicted nucleotidyltransferase
MIQKCNISETAGLFFSNPSKTYYLMEISRKIKLAHTSVKKNLYLLKKYGIITETIEKKGKRKYPLYKANINSEEFRKQKKIFNYQSLMESGLVNYIGEKLMPKSIVLFGSFQKGEDFEDSDIDLFVECKKEQIELKLFEKLLNRKIELHFNDNFNNYPKELKNNIANGIVVYGFLEAYK